MPVLFLFLLYWFSVGVFQIFWFTLILDLDLNFFKSSTRLCNGQNVFSLVQMFQEWGQLYKFPVLLISQKLINLIEIFRLQYARHLIVINQYDLFQISAKNFHILQIVNLVNDNAMIPVQHMGDSLLRIDLLHNLICILFLTRSEHYDLIQLGHFEQKGIQTKSLYGINSCWFTIESYLC